MLRFSSIAVRPGGRCCGAGVEDVATGFLPTTAAQLRLGLPEAGGDPRLPEALSPPTLGLLLYNGLACK